MAESIFFWVAGIAAIILLLRYIGIYVFIPFNRWARAVNAFIEAQPTLLQIAEEFKQNSGSTLRDQVDSANMRLENIEQQLELLLTADEWDGTERRA